MAKISYDNEGKAEHDKEIRRINSNLNINYPTEIGIYRNIIKRELTCL